MTDLQRRFALKSIAGALLLSGGVGTVAATAGERDGASAPKTIFEIAEASDEFDVLEAALVETGLDAVLNSVDDQYTVFAPTHEAF